MDPAIIEPKNKDYEWLTYETIINQHIFRKTNQVCQMGLFIMPLECVSIYLKRNLDPEITKILAKAFVPDLTVEQFISSAGNCPWQKQTEFLIPISTKICSASRTNDHLHIGPRIIMPYNFIDNDSKSGTLGTTLMALLNPQIRLIKLDSCWNMWKTASRSCVVEICEINLDKESKLFDVDITFENQKSIHGEQKWAFQKPLTEKQVLDTANGQNRFHLKNITNQCFSIKTGIKYVGTRDMNHDKEDLGKDVNNGCILTDLISFIDENRGHVNKEDKCLIIFHEIMGVIEKSKTSPNAKGNGFLVRDISCIDPSKVYVPALSIPFLDLNLNDLKERFEFCPRINLIPEKFIDEVKAKAEKWSNFWKVNYAELLGRGKALLLLRYGLQALTPNPQNFLLEFDRNSNPPKPTGRLFIRDIGDASPVRDLFLQINFKEEANPELIQIIEQIDIVRLTPIRMNWHHYSAFSKGISMDQTGTGYDPEAQSENWREVLALMADWGLAHAKAYVSCIDQCIKSAVSDFEKLHKKNNSFIITNNNVVLYHYCMDIFSEYPQPKYLAFKDKDEDENFSSARQLCLQFIEWENRLGEFVSSFLLKFELEFTLDCRNYESINAFELLQMSTWKDEFMSVEEFEKNFIEIPVDRDDTNNISSKSSSGEKIETEISNGNDGVNSDEWSL